MKPSTKRRLSPEERRERRRRAVQRSKFAIPSGITLLSMLCGFSSVVMSINAAGDHSEWHFLWAAGLLLLAGVFDGLDGHVARATHTTSEFGVQLDSLADALSFGMAPAILAYRYGFFHLGMADKQIMAVGWAACFFFLACGALRLARFNVQVRHADPRFFVGMPIPGGAACVVSVILFWPEGLTRPREVYLFAAELFIVGVLMISTVRFPSFKKRSHHPQEVVYLTLTILVLLTLLIIFRTKFFLGFAAAFTTMALLMNLAWKHGWRGVDPPASLKHETPDGTLN